MSVGSIKVTPQQMRTVASNITNGANEWDASVKKIIGYVHELDAMWDGLGNDTFNAIWKSDEGSFTKLSLLMREYAQTVNKAADNYDTGEQEVRAIVSSR